MGPTPSSSPVPDPSWYGGSIQYLLNISAIGAASCVLLFLLVKLRSDHRPIPGPSALLAKLLAVYHARIALHCGADASQFLHIERSSFFILLSLSLLSLLLALPINLYSPSSPATLDDFSRTTITNIPKSSPLLWAHFFLMLVVVLIAHLGISSIEEKLRLTRFQDTGELNPSAAAAAATSNPNTISIFTIMVQGIPKTLAADKTPLEEYFQHRYPGKVFRLVVPFNLSSLESLTLQWAKLQNDISWLEARIDARALVVDDDDGAANYEGGTGRSNSLFRFYREWRGRARELWMLLKARCGFTDEERLRKLQNLRLVLENMLTDFREGRAPGAGIAFVVFKDVYTTNKAMKDFRTERKKKKKPIGQFFPLMELQLERSRWRVERAPPASDIYWSHLGLSKLSLRLRRVAVNTLLVLMLLFCSSPLALISAVKTAARIIDAEAMDSAQSWLDWFGGSGWLASVVLQFMPNVVLFVSMYIIIPSVLSYLSKFERHLTVSGEQRAALLKMVCFFLVNLILLRALVESSLESTILGMGKCYLDGEDCKRIEEYMSPSFLSRSCLSSLAFLITSTFLGISFDLLAPIPWIKKTLKKFQKNDMLQLAPEANDDYLAEHSPEASTDNLTRPLMSERQDSLDLNDNEGQHLSIYPINRSFRAPKHMFDFAQYYAFNLTIFALTMIYSLFAPLVVPVGAIYFGYRYVVDKYNFLFVYRVRGFPTGNDGKLVDRVLCIMHFCVLMFLLSMLLYFSVQGDSTKLQAIFTLGILFLYKLLPSNTDVIQPSILEGLQTVDSFVDGPTDYEIFSRPEFDWDIYQY